MNLVNYESYWKIDHVEHCLLFNRTNEKDQKVINHFLIYSH